MIDLALRGGLVVDGTGAPGYVADVGVQGDHVVAIGRVPEAAREIDIGGSVIAPGFVDPHSHSDWTIHANRRCESTIRQGVTTEIVGNCGVTNAPVTSSSVDQVKARLEAYGYDGPVTWRSFGEYLDDVEGGGISANLAFFVGHSTVREAAQVLGSEPVERDALSRMAAMVNEAMDAGALGLSSGLEYSYGAGATTSELTSLAREMRGAGIYASHIRNRDSEIFAAIDEFLAVVRGSGAGGQVSHLNVRHDTGAPAGAWYRAVERLQQAADVGLDVRADTTPFEQGVGMMTGILPRWLLQDGPAAAAEALDSAAVRDRLRNDCDRYWRFLAKGQWHRATLLHSEQFPQWQGLSLAQIADEQRRDPWDTYFDILQAAGAGMHNVILVGDLFTPEHSAEMVAHPDLSLGVDAWSMSHEGGTAHMAATPLSFCGHVHYLSHHVRANRTLTLEEAVRKMTSLPADRFGLARRGRVEQGWMADLVVFDAERISSASTFADARVYPEGIDYVVVNGVVAVERGRHAGSMSGRVLRRAQTP